MTTPRSELHATRLLLAALAGVIAPLLLHLPYWLSAATLILGAWYWRSGTRMLARRWRWSLAILVMIAVAAGFGTLFGRDAGTTLLVALLLLKLLEFRGRRDAFILVFLGCFLLLTHFLYNQTFLGALYASAALWLLLAANIIMLRGANFTFARALRLSGLLLLQAVPLMLALFLLFPRLPGPLWNLPRDAYSGMSGLDDSLTFGTIGELALSDEIVLRAQFDGPVPPPAQRYWRGPVLDSTDGRQWRSADAQQLFTGTPRFAAPPSRPYSYTVTLEPHNRNWLFALDLPATLPADALHTRGRQLMTLHPVRQRIAYRVVSFTDYNTGTLERQEAMRNVLLPARNPRATALAQRWRSETNDVRAIVDRALRRYSEQNFAYTLTPPVLAGADPVDAFLFDTRRGFCEHYAASFVWLMRAAGIPARIVTGYQGGEFNPIGHYLVVRQRDAHAWAEVWLAGQGWVRVDPTAAVSPLRIDAGAQALAPSATGLLTPRGGTATAAWWIPLRQGIDALQNGWNQWVLGYNKTTQARLMQRLGIDMHDWRAVGLALGLVAAAMIGLVTLAMLRRQRQAPATDPAQRLYRRYCDTLAALAPHSGEGPLDHARRLAALRPELATEVQGIARLYTRLRYSPDAHRDDLTRLRRAIRRLRIEPLQATADDR